MVTNMFPVRKRSLVGLPSTYTLTHTHTHKSELLSRRGALCRDLSKTELLVY